VEEGGVSFDQNNSGKNSKYDDNKLNIPISWILFPGWLDVVFILMLYMAKTHFDIAGMWLLAMIAFSGLIRYLILISRVGLINYSSKNWYIKQIVILSVAGLVIFLYEQDTFTWLFTTYFAELLFFELIVSIVKGALKK
jgi:hypothetical protein